MIIYVIQHLDLFYLDFVVDNFSALSINLCSIMNPKDTKKSNCRSRGSLKRRRKQRKMKKKEKVKETASTGRYMYQEGGAFQNYCVESLTSRNFELKA